MIVIQIHGIHGVADTPLEVYHLIRSADLVSCHHLDAVLRRVPYPFRAINPPRLVLTRQIKRGPENMVCSN